jgi:hypothetical protein
MTESKAAGFYLSLRGTKQSKMFAYRIICGSQSFSLFCIAKDILRPGVSHFSALKTASQRENIQKISENAIAGWVIVMESIPTYASR